MRSAFWPGLILACGWLAQWANDHGIGQWRTHKTRELLRAKGFCPDCGLPAARCHCFIDGGL